MSLTRRGAPTPAGLRHALIVASLALTVSGCKQQPSAADGPGGAAHRTIDEGALAAAGEQAFSRQARNADATDGDKEDASGRADHWKGVHFDVHNFDEVLDYVTTYYIDDKIPHKRAWIASANNALGLLEPEAELLPAAFLAERKGHADEEGRLDGLTEPFRCKGEPIEGVVLHHIPSFKYLRSKRGERKRLSDEEIMQLRAKAKTRYGSYRAAWKPIQFGREQFKCAMGLVGSVLAGKEQRQAEGLPGKPVIGTDTVKVWVWPPRAVVEKVATRFNEAQAPAKTALSEAGAVKPAEKTKRATGQGAKGKGAKGKGAKGKGKIAPRAARAVGLYERDPPEAGEKGREAKIDLNRAWLAAAAAYLHALDPHSAVISRAAWDESTRQTQDSSFEGIGAVLYQRDDVTIIENPMEGLPAWRANVRAGDRIIKVDGVDVRGWMLGKVVKVIRGPKNTKIVLTVEREGVPEAFDIPIVRGHIEIKNVTGKLMKNHPGVAVVKMNGFIPRSTRDLRDKIAELAAKSPGGKLTGLILDLRRNSGGLLNRAIDIADMFLSKGRIVSVKSRRSKRRDGRSLPEESYEARDQDSDLDVPLVVLVNDGSASASEIVASAIQENGRGLVLGLRTFGKASVQTLFEPALHLDYYIKLTVARYYAPSGRTIQVTGVHPDRVLPPKADGKIPVGFREENLTNHLEPQESPPASPWAAQMAGLDACVDRYGRTSAILKREKNPQIQPDYQMLKAADYVSCLTRLRK